MNQMKSSVMVLSATFLFLFAGPHCAYAIQEFYTVQTASFSDLEAARNHYDSIMQRMNKEYLHHLRIEKIGVYFSVRIGMFEDRVRAEKLYHAIKDQFPPSILRKAYFKEERIKLLYSQEQTAKEHAMSELNSNGDDNSHDDALPDQKQMLEDAMKGYDDKRPEEQLRTTFLGRPLTIGGEYDIKASFRADFRLDDHEEDDLVRIDQRAELEFLYEIGPHTSLFLEVKPFYKSELYRERDDPEKDEKGIKRGEIWIFFQDIHGSNFSMQLGRQSFDERRGWWWDEDLDALRVYYRQGDIQLQAGVAEELAKTSTDKAHIDPEDENILRILGQVRWNWDKRHRGDVFLLYHEDHSGTESEGDILGTDQRDESDADLLWAGARLTGRSRKMSFGRVHYWLDVAALRGDESVADYETIRSDKRKKRVTSLQDRDVSGWALDSGFTWETRFPRQPRLTFGYAVGSGDRQGDDEKDRAFRQTGLHDNDGRFLGVNSFRYYGELLRPELSNLHILTASLGIPLLRNSSVEFLYHHYWQYHAATFLRDARIKADPLGDDRSIGQEWNIVIGIEEWTQVECELVGALFRAGDAFGPLSEEMAGYTSVTFNYNF